MDYFLDSVFLCALTPLNHGFWITNLKVPHLVSIKSDSLATTKLKCTERDRKNPAYFPYTFAWIIPISVVKVLRFFSYLHNFIIQIKNIVTNFKPNRSLVELILSIVYISRLPVVFHFLKPPYFPKLFPTRTRILKRVVNCKILWANTFIASFT